MLESLPCRRHKAWLRIATVAGVAVPSSLENVRPSDGVVPRTSKKFGETACVTICSGAQASPVQGTENVIGITRSAASASNDVVFAT